MVEVHTESAKRDMRPLLYSVEEVGKLIGFGRTLTYELVRSGEIPSIIVAGRKRVRREALEAWIESQARSAPEQRKIRH
jgi:excisionase family DNA binding protein